MWIARRKAHRQCGDNAEGVLELRSALLVESGDLPREAPHAAKVILPLRESDGTTRIEEVENVGELEDVVVRWYWQPLLQQPLRLLHGATARLRSLRATLLWPTGRTCGARSTQSTQSTQTQTRVHHVVRWFES